MNSEYKKCPVCKKQRSTKVFEEGICVVCLTNEKPEYKRKGSKWDEED